MKLLIKWLALLSVALILTACTSQPTSVYKPANNAGYGYKEIVLGDNYYRVEFKITGNAKKAQNFALMRAAEITTTRGYDWFVVLKRNNISSQDNTLAKQSFNSRPVVVRKCGLLMCRDDVQTIPSTSMNDNLIEDTTAVLEIKLGKGVRPSLDNTYDAREINEQLRTQHP